MVELEDTRGAPHLAEHDREYARARHGQLGAAAGDARQRDRALFPHVEELVVQPLDEPVHRPPRAADLQHPGHAAAHRRILAWVEERVQELPGHLGGHAPEGAQHLQEEVVLREEGQQVGHQGGGRPGRLSQEQAQKFIDLALARETAATTRSVEAFVDLQNQWVSEIKADPDIGGDRLKASLASVARAIDRLDVPGLREALNFTGAGNHPAVVKAFVRLGQMISEDRYRPGRSPAPGAPRSPAEVIYDGQPRT